MPDKAWKNRERLVSKFFGGIRNALSGINSKSLMQMLFIKNCLLNVS